MSGSFCSLHREIHYIVTLLIVKGAGICSLFHEIHYIMIRYIEVWVYCKIGNYLFICLILFSSFQAALVQHVTKLPVQFVVWLLWDEFTDDTLKPCTVFKIQYPVNFVKKHLSIDTVLIVIKDRLIHLKEKNR